MVDGAGKPVGMLGRGALIKALKTLGPDARVAGRHEPGLPHHQPPPTLEQAFKVLQEKSAPAVGVVDAAGKLAGFVTGETVAEMMMVQEALPRGAIRAVGPAGARNARRKPPAVIDPSSCVAACQHGTHGPASYSQTGGSHDQTLLTATRRILNYRRG